MNQTQSKKLFSLSTLSIAISTLGNTLFYPVMLAIAATMPNPATAMLLVSLSEGTPILLSVFMGALADRAKMKYQLMQFINIARFGLYTVAAILFFINPIIAFYTTIVINFISDCLGHCYMPVSDTLFKTYTAEDEILTRQGMKTSVNGIITIVGPLLGSLLLTLISVGFIVQFNALSFLLAGLILFFGRTGFKQAQQQIRDQAGSAPSKNMMHAFKTAFLTLRKNRDLMQILSVAILLNLLFSPIQKIILPLQFSSGALPIIGTFAFSVSLFMTVTVLGMVVGSQFVRFFEKYSLLKVTAIATIPISIVIALLGVATSTYVVLFLGFILGLVISIINTLFSALILKETPTNSIGITSSLTTLIAAGGMIVGDIIFSFLLNFFPGNILMIIMGGIAIAYTVFFFFKNYKSM